MNEYTKEIGNKLLKKLGLVNTNKLLFKETKIDFQGEILEIYMNPGSVAEADIKKFLNEKMPGKETRRDSGSVYDARMKSYWKFYLELKKVITEPEVGFSGHTSDTKPNLSDIENRRDPDGYSNVKINTSYFPED